MYGIYAATFMTATRHDLPARPVVHPARQTGTARPEARETPPRR